MIISNRFPDTILDTKKIIVSVKYSFAPHSYINKDGMSLLYLDAWDDTDRKRVPLDVYVPRNLWCSKKKKIVSDSKEAYDTNLIIGKLKARINEIKISYRLTDRDLTLDVFIDEFLHGIPRVSFVGFAYYILDKEKKRLTKGTFNRHRAVISKVKAYRPKLTFSQINMKFISEYRQHLANIGNAHTTIEANISSIKKFLNAAKDHDINLAINPEKIKVGKTSGNRTDLQPHEVKRLIDYFESTFINETQRIILGYFLFSCFTGLRVSEVLGLNPSDFEDGHFEFYEQKNNRVRRHRINQSVRMLLKHCKNLFQVKYEPQYMNRELKQIMKVCGIRKKVTFHVGRHTFATNFLRAGGDIISLQKMLGHSDLRQTMIYVHIVESEANEKVFLVDKLFQ